MSDVFSLIGGPLDEISTSDEEEPIEISESENIKSKADIEIHNPLETGNAKNIIVENSDVDIEKSLPSQETSSSLKTDSIDLYIQEVPSEKQDNVAKGIPTLYFIGLGLGSETDISVRGLQAIKSCDNIFLEAYTSVLGVSRVKLEEFYGKKITVADRHMVESEAEVILNSAKKCNTALLVVGDPFGATTHSDMWIRAKRMGIRIEVIHNASIMNAVGCCGLQLYRFGESISVCFFREKFRPDSFYSKIVANRKQGLHTLCLLDIKVKEPDYDKVCKGLGMSYLPPRYMTCKMCIEQLLEVEAKYKEGVCLEDSMCVGMARIGRVDQAIAFGTLKDVAAADLGGPLHSLILCGELHELELEMLDFFKCT